MADAYESDWEDPNEDIEDQDQGDPPEDDEGEQELNGYEEPDEQDDLDAQEQQQEPQRPQRKSFSQRVDEVVERRLREMQNRQTAPAAPAAPQPPRETPEQFRARIANMDQVQFAEFMLQQQQAAFNQIQFNTQEAADKAAFDVICRDHPQAQRLRDKVEARLTEMRAGGQTVAREVIFKFLLGEMAYANATKATNRTRKTADANKQRQTARAPSGGSDTGRTTTDTSKSARDKRLNDVQI